MTKIDLITGCLGAGKTEFLKKYARYLMEQGEKICILENDFGAINVDMVLLHDLQESGCDLEMVIGGDGAAAHQRRFKTKLITMGMKGYDRVLIEPSGVFDMDEFFDVLYEEPLDSWYQIGNVITIVEAGLAENLSEASDYLLASQAADAGQVIFSKCQLASPEKTEAALEHLNRALVKFQCKRQFDRKEILTKDWEKLTEQDFEKIRHSSYRHAELVKMLTSLEEAYTTQFVYGVQLSRAELEKKCRQIFGNPALGNVFRIKGFVPEKDGYLEVNATREQITFDTLPVGQEVLIVIGERLRKEEIEQFWKK